MKYCKYCGAELSNDANVCSRCGHSLGGSNVQQEKGHHGLGIAGFILSLLSVQPLALIFSIIGLAVGKRNGNKTGLAVAGLVISIIYIVVEIIIFIVAGPMIMEMYRELLNGMTTALAIL
ncbi:MAG: zinc ribbon domain-containing protein [Clostridiales bacterium]|nr:zinc ribbon domain-containing protein [Clostridiales bacterium]